MQLTVVQILCIFTLGQIFLVLSLNIFNPRQGSSDNLHSCLLLVMGMMISQPIAQLITVQWQLIALLMALPALLSLAPLLWLYVDSLTSKTTWHFQWKHALHFLPAAIGGLCALLTGLLPDEVKYPLLTTGDVEMTPYVGGLMISAFVLILGWTVQSVGYIGSIVKRLKDYRQLLKQKFANNEHRELRWLDGILLVIALGWLLAIVSILAGNLIDIEILGRLEGTVLGLVLTWLIAIFGIRQSPGLEGHYEEEIEDDERNISENKYTRSALEKEQSQRIASKIDAVMGQKQLYLKSDISLSLLAEAVGSPANYVSQTLNQTMECNFFDYINRWRIEAACPMILENKQSVLDVALTVGFNARSSFYNAFKQHTGMTPSEYRKTHQSKESTF